MKIHFLRVILIGAALFFVIPAAQTAYGQNSALLDGPIPKSLREKLVKMRIAAKKEDFAKLLKRSELVAKLGDEIHCSFEKNRSLTLEDRKKLIQMEKLLKKIRRELNAKRDDKKSEQKKPKSLLDAIDSLQASTSMLFMEVKNHTRHSISVSAIQSSNAVWKLVKFIRLRRR